MASKSTKTTKTAAKSAKTSRAKAGARSVSTGRKSTTVKRAASKSTASRGSKAKTPAKKTNAKRAHLPGLLSRMRSIGKGSTRSNRAAKPRQPRPISTGLSLDRKLDIAGIVFSLFGLLTLLSLLSSSHSTPTGSWLNFLALAFGRASYIFPPILVGTGLWLVLRNFERIPQLSIERGLGLALLYLNFVVMFHFFSFPDSVEASLALAAVGKGGGYTGAFIFNLLYANLGWGGAAVALFAWLLIALAMALDVAIAELFRWIPPLVLRFQDGLDELRNHRQEQAQQAFPAGPVTSSAPMPVQPGKSTAPIEVPPFPTSSWDQKTQTWVLPALEDILDLGTEALHDDDYDRQRARIIEETLSSFGAPVNVVEINRGPTITQFGVEPDFIENRNGRTRVRVNKISSLADDLALALSARSIRVEAPVPGKGYVGIEVPNDEIATVALRDVIESEAFRRLKSSLSFALGQDVAGNAVAADLSAMPHLLIAGQTGSGKSVCVNAIIACYLLNNTPDNLRMIMVDPKRVELTGYNGIPHLLAPVVVEMERVVGALQWVLREMDMRYHKLADVGARNIVEFNNRMTARGEKKLPYLVVVIDELADLMMLAPEETERTITRLAQLARATGIHLVIATQRPSVDVVTGLIKANFPARVAFAVASGVDSRVILDQPGAERLLGRGDMLFLAPDAPAPLRLQGVFVSDSEIQRLVHYWRGFSDTAKTMPTAAGGIVDSLPSSIPLKQMPLWEEMQEEDADPMLNEAIDLCRRQGRASISMLQRRLRIGYTRAARIIETMQSKGIIGTESQGVQGFEILDYGPAAPPVDQD